MKMALIKTNLKTKISTANQQQPTARTGQRKTETGKKELRFDIRTHLTISGVCTTIRPENSGT
jgi:DNA primase catalytic subunit